jgi:hypothetical protein
MEGMIAAPPDGPGQDPERSPATEQASHVARSLRYDATRPNRARKINSARALRLWSLGASDVAIAEACGVGRRGAKAWRDARELPPNRQQGGASGRHRLTPEGKVTLLRRLAVREPLGRLARDFGLARPVVAWHRDRAAGKVGRLRG